VPSRLARTRSSRYSVGVSGSGLPSRLARQTPSSMTRSPSSWRAARAADPAFAAAPVRRSAAPTRASSSAGSNGLATKSSAPSRSPTIASSRRLVALQMMIGASQRALRSTAHFVCPWR
jgi:hypothetical protein